MSGCGWLSDGEQRRFPGTRAESTLGDCRWLCAYHARSLPQGLASQYVEASQRWASLPNTAEAWVDRRRREVYANEPPYVTALRERLKPRKEARTSPLAKWLPAPIRQPGDDEELAA